MKSELATPQLWQRDFWVTDGADIVSPEWPSVEKLTTQHTRPSGCALCYKDAVSSVLLS